VFAEYIDDPVALKIGEIISKMHASTISNGHCLEKILQDPALNPNAGREGHVTKFNVWQRDCPSIVGKKKIEIDYLVIDPDRITLYEIKDGDAFDTKKSAAEINSLKIVQAHFKTLYPARDVLYHIVLWNAVNISSSCIKMNNLEEGVVITGAEFCSKYGINYSAIKDHRRGPAKDNKNWFFSEVEALKIFYDQVVGVDIIPDPPGM
jgi:hypothetical protein